MSKVFKRSVLIMLAFVMTIMMSSALITVYAEDAAEAWTAEDFVFDEAGTTISSLSESGTAKLEVNPEVVIPEGTIGIAANVFKGTAISKVTFPENGFTTIGQTAFQGCTSLTSVTLPDSIESLGNACFNGCSALTECTFPADEKNKLTVIPQSCFVQASLKKIDLPEGIVTVSRMAFQNVPAEEILLPKTLTTIEANSFKNNHAAEITIPENVTVIGQYAFRYDKKDDGATLTTVNLNDKLEKIDKAAFGGQHITEITIPASLKVLESNAFDKNTVMVDGAYVDQKVLVKSDNSDQRAAAGDYAAIATSGSGHVFQFVVKFDAGEGAEPIADAKTDVNGKITTELPVPSSPEFCAFDSWAVEGAEEAVTADTVFTADTTLKAKVIAHTEEVIPAVEATCTEAGKTEGKKCSVCGKVLVEQTEVPALGHKSDEGKVTKAATTTSEGQKTFTCTVCGKKLKTETIPKLAKKAQLMTVKAKTVKALKATTLKKKAQSLAVSKTMTIKNAKGTKSFKIVKVSKAKKYFKINSKTGKLTIKKGLKKGTYTVKIQVKAAGNDNYKAGAKNVYVKIKVK